MLNFTTWLSLRSFKLAPLVLVKNEQMHGKYLAIHVIHLLFSLFNWAFYDENVWKMNFLRYKRRRWDVM